MDNDPEPAQVQNESPNVEKSFPCTFEGCSKTFSSLAILCTHEAVCRKAGTTPRASCEICGSRTSKLKQHMLLHQPPQHQCPVCKKMFHFRYNLNSHLKIHAKVLDPLEAGSNEATQLLLEMVAAPRRLPIRKTEPESFPCTICPAVFKTKKTLQYHMNVHEGLTPFKCRNEGCDEAFANHQDRYYHERVCRGESNTIACKECGLEVKIRSIAMHMRRAHQVVRRDRNSVIKDKLYPCGQCSAVLKSEKTLRCHVNQHNGIKPYQCRNEGCRESFTGDSNRRAHEKLCRETASTCPVCGLALANWSVRQDHMAAFHKDDTVLAELLELEDLPMKVPKTIDPNKLPDSRKKCPECGKIFSKPENFAYHMNKHKGFRPYACVKCTKAFFSKQAHMYHERKCLAGLKLRRSPGSNPIKPTTPVVKRTVEKKTLKEKKQNRKPPPRTKTTPTKRKCNKPKAVPKQCELCNQVLRSELMYERHMAVHNGAGFYRCKHNNCTESFQTLRERQLHEAERHGGTMPEEPKSKERKTYMCEICSKVFYGMKNFRTHMNLHSGIKKFVCRNEGCEETFFNHSARLSHEEPCRGEVSTCPVCDIKLKTKNILRIHLRRKHPDQLPPSTVKARDASSSITENKKIFTCTLCSREYRTPKSLGEHMNEHLNQKPFQCRNEGCTERFTRRVVRSYHEEGCRGLVAPCPFCDAVLKNSITLKNHVASYHVVEKESFIEGIIKYKDQLRPRSELEKNAERVDRAEEVTETPDEMHIDVKDEVNDEMQIEWLEDIVEENELESEHLEVKEEVIEEGEQGDNNEEGSISSREEDAEEENSTEMSKLDEVSLGDNSDEIQVELETVEIKSEVDSEDEKLTDDEWELLVKPKLERSTTSSKIQNGSFKCRNGNGCLRTFGNKQSRTQHEPHCRGESFRCPRKGCSYGPTSKLNIQNHVRQNHAVEGEENENTTIFTEENAMSKGYVMNVSSGKVKFECEECMAVFSTAHSMKYHINRHKGVTPYPCQNSGCGMSFASAGERRNHICQGEVTPRICPFCSTEFPTQQRLWYHMHTKHNPNKDQRHICDVCGASLASEKTLRHHMNKHETEPFECRKEGCDHTTGCGSVGVECPTCQVQLANEKVLEIHIRKAHKRKAPGSFMCEICSKLFRGLKSLKNHLKTHVTKKPVDKLEADTIDVGNGWVKCGECSKYLRKSYFDYHMNSHRGVRPYGCTKCQQGFFSKQAQWAHEKKCLVGKKMRKSPRVYIPHVDMEPKEPIIYECPVCAQTFPNRHTLHHHKQRHLGPIICTEGCNKSFSRTELLRKHMRECHGIGTNVEPKMEKTLKCAFCPMMFGYKASLVRHIKLHDDSSRPRCNNEGCNKTFANEKLLSKHLVSCSVDVSMFEEQ